MSSKNKRPCPATGGFIKPAVCGAERNRVHDCPPTCPFNPFSPDCYSEFLKIESALDQVSLKRLYLENEAEDPGFWSRYVTGSLPDIETHGTIVSKMFEDRDAEDRTFCDRWERDGFEGLRNDEINLLQRKRHMRFGLLEVVSIGTDARLAVRDLLRHEEEPSPFIDRSVSQQACRFDVMCTWYYSLPHMRRFCGNGIMFPDLGDLDPLDALRLVVEHLGGPRDDAAMHDWCLANSARVFAALTANSIARSTKSRSLIDARFGKVVYELRQPFAKCRARLDTIDDLDLDELADDEEEEGFADARVWLDDVDNAASISSGGEPVLGRVLLGQSQWRVQAMGEARVRKLRKLFEGVMGDHVKFVGERLDDLVAQMSAKDPAHDAKLVVPALLENVQGILIGTTRLPKGSDPANIAEATANDHARSLMDKAIPMLNQKTPREAATDKTLRPVLVRWVKGFINKQDRQNLKTGTHIDLDWLPRELGLPEIDFPPPPRRAVLPDLGEEDFDDAFDDASQPENIDRPPAPKLPRKDLSFREIEIRDRNASEAFETAGDAIDELYDSGSTIIDDLEDAVDGQLTGNAFAQNIPFIFHAWYTLVPPGAAAPKISPKEVRDAYSRELGNLKPIINAASVSPTRLEKIFKDGPQPNLRLALGSHALSAMGAAPEGMHFETKAQIIALALIFTVIDLLDAKLR
ncbi:MAG: hypothetical protein ISQ14_10605 [Verrucomicrobiae bacterium]|nr:hypothetical protein [Verrucomicrobiae bacterium]